MRLSSAPHIVLRAESFLRALAIVILALTGSAAWSQPKTIRNIVPVPAGSTQDILSRLLADEIARAGGPTIVIENRPGAGTAIAAEAVAHALPDGNTLLSNASPFVINPQVRHFDYDPLIFEPICYLARSPTMIVVNGTSPYRTLADLLDAARERPRELTLAGLGPASAIQIAFEMLRRAAKVDMTFVPFPGTTPAINALLGDHVTAAFGNYGDMSGQIRPAAYGRWRAPRRPVCRRCPICRRSRSPAFRTTQPIFGTGWSRPPRRRRT